jgi:hypothetical protein
MTAGAYGTHRAAGQIMGAGRSEVATDRRGSDQVGRSVATCGLRQANENAATQRTPREEAGERRGARFRGVRIELHEPRSAPPAAGVHPVADPPRVAGALNQACSTDVRGLLPHRLGPGDGVTPRRARLARIQLLVPTFAAEVRPEFIPIPLTARVGRPRDTRPQLRIHSPLRGAAVGHENWVAARPPGTQFSCQTRCGQEL